MAGRGEVDRAGCGTARVTAGAALPLYLTLIASSAGAVVNTAVVRRYVTTSLAAFAVCMAVYVPATVALSGALGSTGPREVVVLDDDGQPVAIHAMVLRRKFYEQL